MKVQAARLGDVAEFIRGITFKPEDVVPLGEADSVACFRTKNVQAVLDESDVWAIPTRFVRRSEQLLRTGDLLVSSANSWNLVGKCCWIPELPWGATFGGFVSALRPDSGTLYPRFLYHWFSSTEVQSTIRSFGRQTTNISNLDINRCLDLTLPLPPLPEQRRIAAILDQANGLRAKRRLVLSRLSEFSTTLFLEKFGDTAINPLSWPMRSLGQLTSRFSDGPFGSNLKSSHYVEDGVRVVRLQNIGIGEFVDDDRAYITPEHFGELSKHECRPGDVLIGTLGDPNLRACIQPDWLTLALNKADCVQARPDPKVATAEYLVGLLNQPSTERMAQELIHGQTRLRISMGRLRNLKVPVPPLALQQEFAKQVAVIERLKAVQRASLAKLDALFASLQHRAFRGEL